MITFKTYNKVELQSFLDSESFKEFPFKPITKHRAKSHINNPRAKNEDILLILAFDDDHLAGYIGILPDEIFSKEKNCHCGWLSTLWIHPDSRGKKIAQKLLTNACDAYNGNILITEFTPEAENMYAKSTYFSYLKMLEGKSYHLFSNLQEILVSKNVKWKSVKVPLQLFDASVNILLKTIHQIKGKRKHIYKVQDHLDAELKTFISGNLKENSFNRSLAEIDWITENPWILSSKSDDNDYHFSAFAQRFQYDFLKIYENNSLKTVLLLSVRNKNAKLQFVFGESDDPQTAEVLYHYLKSNGIYNLISFNENLNSELNKKLYFFKKGRNRKYLCHKTLEKELGTDFNWKVSAGDGDPIFT